LIPLHRSAVKATIILYFGENPGPPHRLSLLDRTIDISQAAGVAGIGDLAAAFTCFYPRCDNLGNICCTLIADIIPHGLSIEVSAVA